MTTRVKASENFVGMDGNAGNQYFYLAHNVVYHVKGRKGHLSYIYFIVLTLSQQTLVCTCLESKSFEKNNGKRRHYL